MSFPWVDDAKINKYDNGTWYPRMMGYIVAGPYGRMNTRDKGELMNLDGSSGSNSFLSKFPANIANDESGQGWSVAARVYEGYNNNPFFFGHSTAINGLKGFAQNYFGGADDFFERAKTSWGGSSDNAFNASRPDVHTLRVDFNGILSRPVTYVFYEAPEKPLPKTINRIDAPEIYIQPYSRASLKSGYVDKYKSQNGFTLQKSDIDTEVRALYNVKLKQRIESLKNRARSLGVEYENNRIRTIDSVEGAMERKIERASNEVFFYNKDAAFREDYLMAQKRDAVQAVYNQYRYAALDMIRQQMVETVDFYFESKGLRDYFREQAWRWNMNLYKQAAAAAGYGAGFSQVDYPSDMSQSIAAAFSGGLTGLQMGGMLGPVPGVAGALLGALGGYGYSKL